MTDCLETYNNCPLCNCSDSIPVFKFNNGVEHDVCLNCAHTYLRKRLLKQYRTYDTFSQNYSDDHILSKNNLQSFYARYRYNFFDTNIGLNNINAMVEIGCGYGHFLNLIHGIYRVGIDASTIETTFAKKYFKIENIYNDGYENVALPQKSFELVCSFHMLEHLEQPGLFISYVKSILKDGGYLYISVPNLLSLKPDFIELFFLNHGLHLNTFSPKVLAIFLQKNNFRIINIKQEPSTPMLRSSFSIIAQYIPHKLYNTNKISDYYIDRTIVNLQLFYNKFMIIKEGLESYFNKLYLENKRIAIYGSGIHTLSILELLSMKNDIILIDDDSNKQHKLMHNFPILNLEEALEQDIDVILVSSLSSEKQILKKLSFLKNIKVCGIYDRIEG